jgi:hypothetical protein
VSWSVIKNAERSLNHSLTFKYPDWHVTAHGAKRLDSTIQQLLNDGHITKDPAREKQWIGSQIVKRLATAVLTNAAQRGASSWDTILAGTFSLVLQAAVSSRSGDIKQSLLWTGEEYLKWRDIEIMAVNDSSTADNDKMVFRMKVTLSYRKGFK